MSDRRLEQLKRWLNQQLKSSAFRLAPASADASFRRYFRITFEHTSYIVMDAPPERESCRPFVTIAQALSGFDLQVPEILEIDFEQGFLLLEDFGSTQYLDALNSDSADALYGAAITALIRLQRCGEIDNSPLPSYSRKLLMQEMTLFQEWFLKQHLGHDLTLKQQITLTQSFIFLTNKALEQPHVWVHRDYHSRNLMLTDKNSPGILDFQDAVIGPLTYDLVSLLRDCYIHWPQARIDAWLNDYRCQLLEQKIVDALEPEQLVEWFDLMGVQRHLKAVGIFARLNIRDGKPNYLKDIPRTLDYISAVSERYPSLHPLNRLIGLITSFRI